MCVGDCFWNRHALISCTPTPKDENGSYKLPAEEVATIKRELVGLMISSPSNIQTQLGESISIIADSDFWERWDTLMPVGRIYVGPGSYWSLLTAKRIGSCQSVIPRRLQGHQWRA